MASIRKSIWSSKPRAILLWILAASVLAKVLMIELAPNYNIANVEPTLAQIDRRSANFHFAMMLDGGTVELTIEDGNRTFSAYAMANGNLLNYRELKEGAIHGSMSDDTKGFLALLLMEDREFESPYLRDLALMRLTGSLRRKLTIAIREGLINDLGYRGLYDVKLYHSESREMQK